MYTRTLAHTHKAKFDYNEPAGECTAFSLVFSLGNARKVIIEMPVIRSMLNTFVIRVYSDENTNF